MQRLEERIRHRLSGFMRNVVSRMVQLGEDSLWPGQMVLLTGQTLAQLPGLPELQRMLEDVHTAMRQMIVGQREQLPNTVAHLHRESRMAQTCTFLASLLGDTETATRALLTVGLTQGVLDLIVSDGVKLLATGSVIDVVVQGQGGFQMTC